MTRAAAMGEPEWFERFGAQIRTLAEAYAKAWGKDGGRTGLGLADHIESAICDALAEIEIAVGGERVQS